MLGEAIIAILKNDTTVKAATTDVYWSVAPQSTALPYIVLKIVGNAEDADHDGPDGMFEALIQVETFAASWGGAEKLGNAVRAAILGAVNQTIDGIWYDSSDLSSAQDATEPPANGVGRPDRYCLWQDFRIYYSV